jgi:type IV pilus assembly protein PilB
MLLEAGEVSRRELDRALRVQKAEGGRIGEVLLRLGCVSEATIARVLGSQLQIPYIPIQKWPLDPALRDRLPRETAERHTCLVLGREAGRLGVALADPLDFEAINAIEAACAEQVELYVAEESALRRRMEEFYAAG